MSGRVIVTGAGGFIGAHIAQSLAAGGHDTLATGQSPAAPAHLARFGIPVKLGSLASETFARELTSDATALVHCAFGPGIDTPEHVRDLLGWARDGGVRTVVHMSTVEVYARHRGLVIENDDLLPDGPTYGGTKAAIERAVRARGADFGSLSILRPAIVYGPFSEHWTVRPLRRMVKDGWRPQPDALPGTCNPIHVSDLARLVALLIQRAAPGVATYNAVGPDTLPWSGYYGALARHVDANPRLTAASPPLPTRSSAVGNVLGNVARHAAPKSVRLRLRTLAKKLPVTAVWLEERARRLRGGGSRDDDLYQRDVTYSTDELRKDGLATRISFEAGLAHTLAWARRMGLLETSLDTRIVAAEAVRP